MNLNNMHRSNVKSQWYEGKNSFKAISTWAKDSSLGCVCPSDFFPGFMAHSFYRMKIFSQRPGVSFFFEQCNHNPLNYAFCAVFLLNSP